LAGFQVTLIGRFWVIPEVDWGYFQINTVHLTRPGLNLRDLLDCKTNIDFAYQLFKDRRSFTAWSTYNSSKYRQFMESR